MPFHCFSRINECRRLGAGAALLAMVASYATPVVALSPIDRTGAEAATAAGPVSTAATGARCIGPAFDDTPAFQIAIDTGHTVYAPALGGQCHITHPLVMKTPGQIIHGDGRARTKILIQPGFAGQGIFVAKTGEPGPIWRDFSIQFVQPDTDDRTKLIRYPPAFYSFDTPRFHMEHIGCYLTTYCVDMRGNSGGSYLEDLQFNSFDVGVLIDGALDTIRLIDVHWFPFEMTNRQKSIFFSQKVQQSVGISVGRADDLIIRGGLFIGGLALLLKSSILGSAYGIIEGSNFDTYSAIEMDSGTFTVGSSAFTLGVPDAVSIKQSGGNLIIQGGAFIFAKPSLLPAVLLKGGTMNISSSLFGGAENDLTFIKQQRGSFMTLMGNRFDKKPSKSYRNAVIVAEKGSRTVMIGNSISDKLGGNGQFLSIQNENRFNEIFGNSAPGWPEPAK